MLPATDDKNWDKILHGYGAQFYILGPIPPNIDIQSLENQLSQLKTVNPAEPVVAGGEKYFWKPYHFSWRWGKEGDSGHQGYHGLKRTVTDDFLCIGQPKDALHETTYVDEIEGGRYFLWSAMTVAKPLSADILHSSEPPADKSHTSPTLQPAKMYINGAPVTLTNGLPLAKGANTLLVRYDKAGRGHLVVRRHEASTPIEKQPLSMRWANDEGIIPFDITAGHPSAEWFRFVTAPGTNAIQIKALGKVEAWIDGNRMKEEQTGRFTTNKAPAHAAVIALRITPGTPGITGGSLIPEPVTIETTGKGLMHTGDWSAIGVLHNYSGGVRYTTHLKLDVLKSGEQAIIDLGQVAGTSEIIINGQKAGIRVAPPWQQDITSFLKKGDNQIEVLVYNTLANHYQTIPSRYRGEPVSGLIGPVKLYVTLHKD